MIFYKNNLDSKVKERAENDFVVLLRKQFFTGFSIDQCLHIVSSSLGQNISIEDWLLMPLEEIFHLKDKLNSVEDDHKSQFLKLSDRLLKKKGKKENLPQLLLRLHPSRVCIYCNNSFILLLGDRGKRTFEIDHCLPKEQFPIFSICLYNLIPACSTCNRVKGQKILQLLLTQKFNDRIFYYDPSSKNGFRVDPKFEDYFTSLDLHMLYQNFSHIVDQIVDKRKKYPDMFLNDVKNKYDKKFTSIDEVTKLFFGDFIDETDDFVLSKFRRDILKSLII